MKFNSAIEASLVGLAARKTELYLIIVDTYGGGVAYPLVGGLSFDAKAIMLADDATDWTPWPPEIGKEI